MKKSESDDVPFAARIARQKRFKYFFNNRVSKNSAILKIGCGDRWLAGLLRQGGWLNYIGLDLKMPADIIGDIRNWHRLQLQPESMDIIVAFEILEHVECTSAIRQLLNPSGLLFATTPVPSLDWVCKIMETIGLNQKRTSSHDCLVDLRRIEGFEIVSYRKVMGISQWGVLKRSGCRS